MCGNGEAEEKLSSCQCLGLPELLRTGWPPLPASPHPQPGDHSEQGYCSPASSRHLELGLSPSTTLHVNSVSCSPAQPAPHSTGPSPHSLLTQACGIPGPRPSPSRVEARLSAARFCCFLLTSACSPRKTAARLRSAR